VVSSLWCFVGVFITDLGEVVWLVHVGSSGGGEVVVLVVGSITSVSLSLMFASTVSLDSGSQCGGSRVCCYMPCGLSYVLAGVHWGSVGSSAVLSSVLSDRCCWQQG